MYPSSCPQTESPDNTYLVTARYVLVTESDEYKEERYKERFIVGRYLDGMTEYLVHGTQTIQYVSVRITLVVENI